jgi:hypothetical protein
MVIIRYLYPTKSTTLKGSLTSQALGLLSNGHGFEFSQGHYRLIWSLTSGPVGLVEIHANWPKHSF